MKWKCLYLAGVLVILTSCQACEIKATDMAIATAAPLPIYLLWTFPEPGEIYSMAEYEGYTESLGVERACIWVGLWPATSILIEPGDFFSSPEEWLLSYVSLVVDNTTVTEYHYLTTGATIGGKKIDPETGETIWKSPDGIPLSVCYEAPLESGLHTSTLVIEKTSGEQVTYTWQFGITE
jgi:hypothetical protein